MHEVDLARPQRSALTEAADRLRTDGFVLARHAVPRRTLLDFRRHLTARVASGAYPSSVRDWRGMRSANTVEHLLALRRAAYDCPQYAGVFRSAPLTAFIGEALGTDRPFLHPRRWVRVNGSLGAAGGAQPMHQDYWFVQGDPDVYTVWIPLHDCEEGGIRLVPGSHRQGLLDVDRGRSPKGQVAGVDPADAVRPSLGLGDALVFHSLTVHGTVPNSRARNRVSIDGRFQHPRAAIAREQLLPAMAPEDRRPIAATRGRIEDAADWANDPALRFDPEMPIVASTFGADVRLRPATAVS